MNSVQIIGNLGAEPEMKYFESGKVVANIRVAVRRSKDVTDWINATAFDKTAEMIANYCHKGDQIGVTGRLQVDTWVDRESGANRSAMKVIATQITLLRNKGNGNGEVPADDDEPAF